MDLSSSLILFQYGGPNGVISFPRECVGGFVYRCNEPRPQLRVGGSNLHRGVAIRWIVDGCGDGVRRCHFRHSSAEWSASVARHSIMAFLSLKLFGGIYLICLGVQIWRGYLSVDASQSDADAIKASREMVGRGGCRIFTAVGNFEWKGIATEKIWPKSNPDRFD